MGECVSNMYIGDDWVIPLTLRDGGGNPLNLSLFTVGATYFAPSGTVPTTTDLSGNIAIVVPLNGTITVIVPQSLTSSIAPLPAGRKGGLVHIQVFTIETATGFKVTRGVVPVVPVDPSSFDPRPDPGNGPNYQRVSIFPFGEAL